MSEGDIPEDLPGISGEAGAELVCWILMICWCTAHELLSERPDILAGWQKRFRYILIDEFQDINQIQYEIVRMLARPENNLFIVGDDDQSIYRFRGARPEIMLQFPEGLSGGESRILLEDKFPFTWRDIIRAARKSPLPAIEDRYQKTIHGGPGGRRKNCDSWICRPWPGDSYT